MCILNNAHNRREADRPTRQISKHRKTRRHIGQFIHYLSEVCDNHNHKYALMNHPPKPFVRRFVNFDGFSNTRLVFGEEPSDLYIDPCCRGYIQSTVSRIWRNIFGSITLSCWGAQCLSTYRFSLGRIHDTTKLIVRFCRFDSGCGGPQKCSTRTNKSSRNLWLDRQYSSRREDTMARRINQRNECLCVLPWLC